MAKSIFLYMNKIIFSYIYFMPSLLQLYTILINIQRFKEKNIKKRYSNIINISENNVYLR